MIIGRRIPDDSYTSRRQGVLTVVMLIEYYVEPVAYIQMYLTNALFLSCPSMVSQAEL